VGRKPRQHYGGALYHFIARGNNRQPIFLAESDRRAFERFLSDGVERFGHRHHAYCWMTNHVHMAVEVANVPLSHIAHNLLFRYARWFHRKHGRSGHLFERRYRASLISTDAALQSLVRYIHLNPVRAGIVDRPSAYPWSSYSAYSELDSPGPSWLTRNFVLSLFGETPVGARAALRAFTELEVGDGVEDWAQPVTPDSEPELGSYEVLAANRQQAFTEQVASSSITLEKILCAVSSACSLARSELSADVQRRAVVRARSLAGCIVYKAPHLTLEQLGAAVGRDASTLSRAADNIARRLATDPELQDLLTRIESSLSLKRD
jgi:REP element-mobilizing transposase RayT